MGSRSSAAQTRDDSLVDDAREAPRGGSRRLTVRRIAPGRVDAALCRQLWDLRLANVDLRPETNREENYRSFQKFFDQDTTTVTFWSQDGRLQGFYGWNQKQLRVEGERFCRVVADYLFMNRAFRGRTELPFSILRLSAKALLTNPRTKCVVVGLAYPGSFVSVRMMRLPLLTLQSKELTANERRLLEDYANEYGPGCFDPKTGLVRMKTLPHLPSRTTKSPAAQAALAEYEAQNPRWREGYCLPMLAPANWKLFWSSIAHVASRTLRRPARRARPESASGASRSEA